jgi:hypothetical protein
MTPEEPPLALPEEPPLALPEDAFAYRAGKDGRAFVTWHGRTVTTLKGTEAARFLARIVTLQPHEAQLAMAKLTGNFKRGNERTAKTRENARRR